MIVVPSVMKRGLIILTAAVSLLAVSCYDDSEVWETLRDHEARIARLEALCNQYNTTISSLQTIVEALQTNNSIKDVTPVMENGIEIGYTITFTRGNPITIYHGKNGQDGKDGQDGNTPVIGVKQDPDDGMWYWTLDDDWLLKEDGKKIQANATAPTLKVEDDYWWVSYNNGSSWTKLDKAVGRDGDSMFESVTQDQRNVYFTLTNGQVIIIPKGGLYWEYVD